MVSEDKQYSAHNQEIERLLDMYVCRDKQMPVDNWIDNQYHPRNSLGSLFHSQNREALVSAINSVGIDLQKLKVLDVGCGYGYWLRSFVELGSNPEDLFGVDILNYRIEYARKYNSSISWSVTKGDKLEFKNGFFDIVLQSLVFSSTSNDFTRKRLANEMIRVNKPGGYIFWIDHRKNHGALLSGYPEENVLKLFPNYSVVFRDRLHPSYFRRFNKRGRALAILIYSITRFSCDSSFFVLKKNY